MSQPIRVDAQELTVFAECFDIARLQINQTFSEFFSQARLSVDDAGGGDTGASYQKAVDTALNGLNSMEQTLRYLSGAIQDSRNIFMRTDAGAMPPSSP